MITMEEKLKQLEYAVERAYRKIEEKHIAHFELELLRSEKILIHMDIETAKRR